MITNNYAIRFENDTFKCRCLNGKCPNYNEAKCGDGGEILRIDFSYKKKLETLKKKLKRDEYVGTDGFYARQYRHVLREKKNGKQQISMGED
jgi:hypothetical protein